MTRLELAAAVALAPLILAVTAHGQTVTVSSGTNTPVETATASNGSPANVDISSGGSINLQQTGQTAATLNSSNNLSLEGQIGSTNLNNTVGVNLVGGNTGSFNDIGTILLTETYQANTDLNTGVLYGPFAQGSARTGILVNGAGALNGGVIMTGGLTVLGNNSYGVQILSPITGGFTTVTVSPTTFTSSTSVTVGAGSISMTGSNSVGFYSAPGASIGGNVNLSSITVTGTGSQGVNIIGNIGGALNLSGAVTITGYRTTSRSTVSYIQGAYTAGELTQSGAAVTIGGQVGGGMIISAPPVVLSATNPDLDNNGVPDAQQGTGSITSYASAPALSLGVSGQSGGLGVLQAGTGVTGSQVNAYGFVNQGSITGDALFDPVTTPSLTGVLPSVAVTVGTGSTSNAFLIQGGLDNEGTIGAQAYQASATAVHFLAGGQTPLILNNGQISAISTQQTSEAAGYAPVSVYGVVIDSGAVVNTIINNGGITASVNGYGGAGALESGAIVDRSGTLAKVVNTGSISAAPVQTVITNPMPIGAEVAIDMSQGTAPESITQSVNASLPTSAAYSQANTYVTGAYVSYQGNIYEAITTVTTGEDPIDYPTAWRTVGAVSPSISGDIYFGNGGSTLSVNAGTVTSTTINLGMGINAVAINGPAGSGPSGATVTGSIQEGSAASGGVGGLTISVNNGTLDDLNPNTIAAKSVNVGSGGLLRVAADPANNINTKFLTSGASTFANGAQVGLTLVSLPSQLQQTFVVLETTGAGTLSVGNFGNSSISNAPYLFSAVPGYTPIGNQGGGEITLTVTEKNAQQLGLNTSEGRALSAVIAASAANPAIVSGLVGPTTQSGFRAVYDQLLPNQGQGLFDALDAAAQSIADMTATNPDNGKQSPGSSLWVQEVNENISRTSVNSPATYTKLAGLVAGLEHMGEGGGAIGLTLSFMNGNELPQAQQQGSGVTSQFLLSSLYYRRAIGGLTLDMQAGAGGAFFNEQRTFVNAGSELLAHAVWNAFIYQGHFGATYEQKVLNGYYIRPKLAIDYLGLDEAGYTEGGGGQGFDLAVNSRHSSRMTGTAEVTLGHAWGKDAWVRTELNLGYIDVLYGNVGDTVASFVGGGAPFSMTPDASQGGWGVIGFSIKAGSASSYFALYGDLEYRNGEQIYDIGLEGRSVF